MKQASLGDDIVSTFDDRQRLSIILVVSIYLATPHSKTPLGRTLLIKDEEAQIKIQVSVH
jgi:hypothetical protein